MYRRAYTDLFKRRASLGERHARVEERVSPSTGNGTKCQLLKKSALNSRFRQKWKLAPAPILKGFTPSKALAWRYGRPALHVGGTVFAGP